MAVAGPKDVLETICSSFRWLSYVLNLDAF